MGSFARTALPIGLLLAAGWPARARAAPRPSLPHAIDLFQNLEDEKATAELHALLRTAPPAAQAATAHVYLGLIALNAVDPGRAREEFKRALSIDPGAELPADSSPKVQRVFDQARREVAGAPSPPPSPPVSPVAKPPAAPALATAEHVAAPIERASRLPAYVTGGVALVTVGVGAALGLQANAALAQAKAAPDLGSSLSLAQQSGTDGLVADILFGAAAVAGVTAIVLFATEGSSSGAPSASVAPLPGGALLSLEGRF
ncbi:MAG: hypothetical protein ACYCWW_13570 [Deltaproteobacteria bacterium]